MRCRQGVYYGTFPGVKLGDDGAPSSVWVVSRPHNWKPKGTAERLLELDMMTGTPPLVCTHTLFQCSDFRYAAGMTERSRSCMQRKRRIKRPHVGAGDLLNEVAIKSRFTHDVVR